MINVPFVGLMGEGEVERVYDEGQEDKEFTGTDGSFWRWLL